MLNYVKLVWGQISNSGQPVILKQVVQTNMCQSLDKGIILSQYLRGLYEYFYQTFILWLLALKPMSKLYEEAGDKDKGAEQDINLII